MTEKEPPTTRAARIKLFYDLLHELPEGPDRDAEIARRSGITDLDFKRLFNDNERAEQYQQARVAWHHEQQSAWRRELIACLECWDELTPADRKAAIVLVRDFFQRLADAQRDDRFFSVQPGDSLP